MLRIIVISILICLTYLTTPTSSASKYKEDESRPYEFRFKIENNQHRYEKRDENGIVMGEFGFVTADGIYHHTVYATDEKGSFKIVAMQNLKIEDIDDLYNIPRPASVPRFEIVPLKVIAPFSYNAVATTPKPNIPVIQAKPLDSKTCSNCKVPTTKRPIPITFAPIQRNTQKPFGVGLPEKLTTYRPLEVTPKPIVSSISEFPIRSEPGIADDYYQVRAPEDQTQPIRKSSILPTQSTFTSSSLQKSQPILQLNDLPNTGKLVNTIKDSIHQVSLQQSNIKQYSPENLQIIQNVGVTKPSFGSIAESLSRGDIQQLRQSKPIIPPSFQSQSPVISVPELLQTIQPPLLEKGPIEQPQIYIKPTNSAESQFEAPVNAVKESSQSLQPQFSPNLHVDQPLVFTQLSTPSQSQFEEPASPLRGSLENVHTAQNIPAGTPITSKQASISSHPPSGIQTSPIRGSISNIQPQTPQNLPVYRNPSSTRLSQLDEPASPVRGFIQNSQPQNKPVEQLLVNTKLATPAQVQFETPAERVSELQNFQPQQPLDIIPIQQPSVSNRPSAPIKTQLIGSVSSVDGNLQSSHPQPSPNLANYQPIQFNTPSIPIQIQSDDSSSPAKESLTNSQLLQHQNGEVDQSLVSREPLKLTVTQILPDKERGSLLNVQPHISQNVPAEQPDIYRRPSTPLQAQTGRPLHPVQDTVQNIKPQISQITPPGQSAMYNKPFTSSQVQFSDPVYPVQGSLPNIQPQISHHPVQGTIPNIQPQHVAVEQPTVYKTPLTPSQAQFVVPVQPVQDLTAGNIQPQLPIQQPPVLGEQIGPIKYQTSYPESVTPQNDYPTLVSPIVTRLQSNVPTVSKMVGVVNKYQYATKNDNGEVLVVEPLSPAPDVRINLPKQLLVSPPRQIDLISQKPGLPKLPQALLTELKETMLKNKNKPAQSERVPLEPINRFDSEINIPKMEQILGNILYRFNYTAGYHGHHEQGDQGGNKEGGYYLITRDGYRRIVDYTANDDGYRPRIHIEFAQPQDVPQAETEKEKGLDGYEFKWFYLR